MDFMSLASERYSERKFDSERKVSREQIEKLLEAAAIAPTGKNFQPWYIYVLESPAALEKAAQCTPMLYGAPLAFLVCYDLDRMASVSTNQVNIGLVDSAIVTTHVMLAATELGLDTCWVCRFDADKVNEQFELPDTREPACFLPIGYGTLGATARHTESKPIAELAKWL